MENYEALMNSREPESGKVYPYSRYIKWLEGRNQNEAADYWETYLKGYEHQTVLPKTAGLQVMISGLKKRSLKYLNK